MNRVWRPWSNVLTARRDCAVKRVTTSTKRTPAAVGRVLAVDLLNLNADDRHFINTLSGKGKCQCAFSRLMVVKVKSGGDLLRIMAGTQTSRRTVAEDKLEAGCAPLALWQAATQTSCRQIRCYRRPLMA